MSLDTEFQPSCTPPQILCSQSEQHKRKKRNNGDEKCKFENDDDEHGNKNAEQREKATNE